MTGHRATEVYTDINKLPLSGLFSLPPEASGEGANLVVEFGVPFCPVHPVSLGDLLNPGWNIMLLSSIQPSPDWM
jgi:hypothetical protein